MGVALCYGFDGFRSCKTRLSAVTITAQEIKTNHLPHIESALLQIVEQTKQKDTVGR